MLVCVQISTCIHAPVIEDTRAFRRAPIPPTISPSIILDKAFPKTSLPPWQGYLGRLPCAYQNSLVTEWSQYIYIYTHTYIQHFNFNGHGCAGHYFLNQFSANGGNFSKSTGIGDGVGLSRTQYINVCKAIGTEY